MSVNDTAPSLMKPNNLGRKIDLSTRLPILYVQDVFACSERHARRMIADGASPPPWNVIAAMIHCAGLVAEGHTHAEVVKAFAEAIK